ncbi:hypothetical protein [uncultured Ruminococcus sp.]|uniref:phosphoribosyltransferase-like protein n=1 Tax=uncultured Ruminococcus sp. TaxID=165186 RepID=UPI002633D93B|nr:hypothetical protein [uncultured Ruminococcus sp.]
MNELYINKCKMFIDFMLSQQQWSGITKINIDSWLNNFKSLKKDEQALVYKLLTHLIYFSENDVIDALKNGVYNCLSYYDILGKQKESKFSVSNHKLSTIHKSNINKSCFVPLLDSDSPHESANNICRALVQQGIISADRSIFINHVPDLVKHVELDNLIIVDDCVGSGDQLRDFWLNMRVKDGNCSLAVKELCQKNGLKANYLTLFGYDKSIKKLQEDFPELNIHCVRILNDQHRVFSDCSYIWENCDERDKAFDLFSSLAKNAGIPIYGYKDLDFAFIMHKTIPDWSLPIFWKENSDWNLLLRRKNSNE